MFVMSVLVKNQLKYTFISELISIRITLNGAPSICMGVLNRYHITSHSIYIIFVKMLLQLYAIYIINKNWFNIQFS